jgi:hypothetical protein
MDSRVRFGSIVRPIVLPLLAAAVVLVSVQSMATTMAGGGPLPDGNALNADCFVYADVAGNHPVKDTKFLQCADGDPTCDQDGTCNGTCVFTARICFGLKGQTACTPPPLLDSVKLNHRCPLTPPTTLQGSACGAFVTFSVPRATKQRPGRRRCTARAKAATSVSGRVDNDVYVFKCRPCASSPSGALLKLTTRR